MRTSTFLLLLVFTPLWFLSLPIAGLMFFVFDGPVSVKEGVVLGIIQATWVAGVPIGLLWMSRESSDGRHVSRWRMRWVLLALGIVAWFSIVVFWIVGSATDNPYA